jgi:hypothetical protein
VYLLIGAFLAVGGSYLAQWHQTILDQKKKDSNIIIEIISLLLDYHSLQKLQIENLKKQSNIERSLAIQFEKEQMDSLHRLSFLALQLQSKKFFGFSVKLTKFVLDTNLRTEQNLYFLTNQAQKLANKKLIKQYEEEIKTFPDKF